jgi:hypothetical protein
VGDSDDGLFDSDEEKLISSKFDSSGSVDGASGKRSRMMASKSKKVARIDLNTPMFDGKRSVDDENDSTVIDAKPENNEAKSSLHLISDPPATYHDYLKIQLRRDHLIKWLNEVIRNVYLFFF